MIGNEIKNIKNILSIKKAAIFGRLAIISNSLNFPRGEFSHSSFSGLPSSSLFLPPRRFWRGRESFLFPCNTESCQLRGAPWPFWGVEHGKRFVLILRPPLQSPTKSVAHQRLAGLFLAPGKHRFFVATIPWVMQNRYS